MRNTGECGVKWGVPRRSEETGFAASTQYAGFPGQGHPVQLGGQLRHRRGRQPVLEAGAGRAAAPRPRGARLRPHRPHLLGDQSRQPCIPGEQRLARGGSHRHAAAAEALQIVIVSALAELSVVVRSWQTPCSTCVPCFPTWVAVGRRHVTDAEVCQPQLAISPGERKHVRRRCGCTC